MGSNLSETVLNALKQGGVDFVVSVPCKLLDGIIRKLEKDTEIIHLPVNREEEGVGICAGASLGGKLPCMVMQNSGLGNSINALASLTTLYRLPLILLISYRGTPGEKVEAQFEMAKLTTKLLDVLNIPTYHMRSRTQVERELPAIATHSKVVQSPVAVLTDFHFWKENA